MRTSGKMFGHMLLVAFGALAGLFDGPTNVRLDSSLVAFNTGGLTGPLGRAASHLLTSYMWNRARRDPRPRLLAVDEPWSLDPTFLETVAHRLPRGSLARASRAVDQRPHAGHSLEKLD